MKTKILFVILGLILVANMVFAEVPEHNPALDSNCQSGFQWSRGTASCKQADCPTGAGRTYTYECNCGEAWDRPFKTCYDSKRPGFVTSCVARGAKCPAEETRPESIQTGISVISIDGDVEYSNDGGLTFKPLTADTKLKEGDYVSTGYDSRATLNFSYATLRITPLTQFRIDEFTSRENINKTQMYLYVGAVMPRNIKHVPAIRSDFSVTTATAISSIRGSEMEVSYDNESNTTTVRVTDDEAYVKGKNNLNELRAIEGQKIVIGSTGIATLSTAIEDKSNGMCCLPSFIFGIVIVGAALTKK
ncbi:MAG: hypothetical protein ACP5N9_03760 [Candidatus Bilamarchaeum sp.]|jgi:hypothetical protein